MTNDEEPDEDEELDEYITSKRNRGIQVDFDPVEAMPPIGLIPAGANGMRRALIESVFS
jgi:hypothetical protein